MQSNEEFVKFLGKGSYGSVDLVKYTRSDGSSFQVAVKTSDADDYDSLNREIEILSELRGYPNIILFYGDHLEEGFSVYGHKVYKLLLEYASEGSLSSFMDNYTDRKLPDPMIRDFTRMILQGLVSIHGHGYVHCDLKSDNLLIFPRGDSSYELKISDFGNCTEVEEVPNHWEVDFPFVGTSIYMPPESFHDGPVKKTLDLWSLGCIVLEMYTGELPWNDVETDEDLMILLDDGKAPEIPESVPCDAREFIETCFARKPEDRGNEYELLLHRFLNREEDKSEKIVVAVVEKKNSFLLKLKMKIKRVSKMTMDIRKKTLNLKVFASKPPPFKKVLPPQFKKVLNKFLRLKKIHLKPLDSNLVSVH